MPIADCGHTYQSPDGGFGAAGYATRPDGKTCCYLCADDEQRALLLTDKRVFAYLSADGKTVITWTGGKLATVTRLKSATLSGFGSTYRRYYIRAVDVHGAHQWTGTSPGPGMYCRLRRK